MPFDKNEANNNEEKFTILENVNKKPIVFMVVNIIKYRIKNSCTLWSYNKNNTT